MCVACVVASVYEFVFIFVCLFAHVSLFNFESAHERRVYGCLFACVCAFVYRYNMYCV